mgnify:CR=1 FL=1
MAQQNKDTNELIKVRRQKLADLQAAGKNPFEIMKYDVTHHSKEIKDNFEELEGKEVAVAGRLMFKRVMGKASFCNVQDLQGGIQAYVARDEIGVESYQDFKKMDIGDIVVLGFDTTLTYEKLSKACHYIRNGCTYFGINPDWNCPIEGGAFIPDCGSMAKLIEASTGRFPEFFGKPSKHTLDYIIQETGYEPDEIAIVGDRLYTDIAVADQSDVTSILVLSGESTREDVKTSDVKPDVILEDLSEITKML